MNTVHVYGTLRKGQPNHGLLAGAEYVRTKCVRGYRMFDLGAFPAVSAVPNTEEYILAEEYLVDDKTLRSLDYLEGHPQFYQRAPVKGGEGEIYVMGDVPMHAPVVETGDWLDK